MPSLVPIRVDDGDFRTAQQTDAALPEFPFASKGDFTTFIQRITMRQDAEYFRPPVPMTKRAFPVGSNYFNVNFNPITGSQYTTPQVDNIAYLVNITPAQLVGGGLLEWNETYASVPIRRVEYGSVTASLQFYVGTVLDATWSGICDGMYVYEYSINTPLPALYAYYTDPAGGIVISGPYMGPYGTSPNQFTQCQNSTSKIWMGQIYERTTTLANFPPIVYTP